MSLLFVFNLDHLRMKIFFLPSFSSLLLKDEQASRLRSLSSRSREHSSDNYQDTGQPYFLMGETLEMQVSYLYVALLQSYFLCFGKGIFLYYWSVKYWSSNVDLECSMTCPLPALIPGSCLH